MVVWGWLVYSAAKCASLVVDAAVAVFLDLLDGFTLHKILSCLCCPPLISQLGHGSIGLVAPLIVSPA